jgi:hypothetical protein
MTADEGNEQCSDEVGGDTGKGKRPNPPRGVGATSNRPFPRRTLEQALRVPRSLKDHNGGNEWDSKEVAKALGIGAGSGNFYYLTAASRDYGLTIGTRDTAMIRITDLGRKAIYPGSTDEEKQAHLDGFLKVESFRKVLEHYKGNALPEYRFLENTLQQVFGIDPAFHEEFLEIFQKNCRFLGIGADYTPGKPSEPSASGAVRPVGKGAATVARPSDSPKDAPVCFVIMPFTEHDDRYQPGFFDEVLINLLTPALTAAGFQVRTARRHGSDIIQATIVNELLEADLVLADLTEHNPNVLFELGMRMAEDRPVVLVRAKGTGAIFDVDSMLRVGEYNPSLWRSALEKDIPRLTEHIIGAWENRETLPTFMNILRRPQ